MAKLFKFILGLLMVVCLVIWDSGSTTVFAQTHLINPNVTYHNQVLASADANLPFLYAAYTIAWGIFFVYIFFISRKQKRMHEELKLLQSLIQEQKSKSKNVKQRS